MARILLIDDDALFRTMLSATLSHFGHTVIEATNGREGLELFSTINADLIITDLVMPETEGIEVLMEIQKLRTGVKIIMMSGGVRGNTADFLEIARHLGASRVLAKPFSNELLLESVNALLPSGAAADGRSPRVIDDDAV